MVCRGGRSSVNRCCCHLWLVTQLLRLSPHSTPLQNLIFRFLQSRQKIQIWLFEQTDLRIEGRIIVRWSRLSPATGACSYRSAVTHVCRLTPLSVPHSIQGFDEYMNVVLDEAEEVSRE